jgi:bifunctional non-homologous end joining protein LigD
VAKRDLSAYRRKRDPAQTPEPMARGDRGGSRKRRKQPVFVVQRHDARRLHYDFRLERDGALASWAVPKGVPLEPGQRALAVHVEDHPLEYATFEGEIPQGQYGAGTVEIWDRGTYELVEEKKDGGLTVRLDGERLQGLWTLIPARLDGDPKNWLLLKKREEGNSEGRRPAPNDYPPMLASAGDPEHIPKGDWLFEIKWDGYRIVSRLRGGETSSLRSRKGEDYRSRFPGVERDLPRALRTTDCVVDGEVCALDGEGRPSFSAMQQAKPETPIVYYVFDLLEVEGEPLVDLPLRERRERLEALLQPRPGVRLSETFDDGKALVEAVNTQRLEGILAKKADSRYRPGERTRDWLKIKPGRQRQEFVIAGYTRGEGRRAGSFGALVLGVWQGDELVYVGNVGTGFSEKTIELVLAKLRALEQEESPFRVVPKMPRVRKADVAWVKPELVTEVEFVEWTHDGRLRAPSFQGLREDKAARDVHREEEEPLPTEIRVGKRVLKLSNLDKVFFPDDGITKGDLLAYYRAVAPVVLPHVQRRPFTMKRYPDGISGGFFFQKDAPVHMPDWIPTREFEVSTRESPRRRRKIRAPLVDDELALLWMVNMGCIDLNTWYSRVDRPERPDFVLFDLDPAADVGFGEVIEVALLVKEVLDALGLVGFAKTSGSDGMHVLVPVERRYGYDKTREFAEIVAGTLARTHRGLVTTEWSKAKRRGVLIDANQNGEGKTVASVYSVRPHPGAPVSTPLSWDEVRPGLDPRAFRMDDVRARIERHGDLFKGVLTTRQSLGAALASIR